MVELKRRLKLKVNGDDYEVFVEPHRTLLEVLNNNLDLTGTKYGCGSGECGACTVLIDGRPVLACLTLAVSVEGKDITTIEGLSDGERLHPIQQALVEHGAIQCGFCTPGFVLKAVALLDENPNPSEEQVREYMRGNLCRCTGYVKIIEGILAAAKMKR